MPPQWQQLPPLGNTEGFAGAFAGESNGTLLLAGGANFPEAKPWEGGVKRWYSDIYALEPNSKHWNRVGELPHALGYGVSASYKGKIICVGGSDVSRHYSEVHTMEYRSNQLHFSQLAPLPQTLANSSGVLMGSNLYVVGGQFSPSATESSKQVWKLNLSQSNATWEEIEPIPGPGRIFANVSATESELFVFGGAELYEVRGIVKRRYLQDAWVYRAETGWEKTTAMPQPLVACGSPAPLWKDQILLVSGDDGMQVGKFPPAHRGFLDTIWAYDIATETWKSVGSTPAPRVTVPIVQLESKLYFLSGEKYPGVRSPENWLLNLE
jgi:N-acetylneuraminic acid mutarotase